MSHVVRQQERGVDSGMAVAAAETSEPSKAPAKSGKKSGGGKRAAALAASAAAEGAASQCVECDDAAHAELAKLVHVPTQMEKDADAADLEMIRRVYGSRAQLLINALLSFDAYFAWQNDVSGLVASIAHVLQFSDSFATPRHDPVHRAGLLLRALYANGTVSHFTAGTAGSIGCSR